MGSSGLGATNVFVFDHITWCCARSPGEGRIGLAETLPFLPQMQIEPQRIRRQREVEWEQMQLKEVLPFLPAYRI
jgi:hypothetical protein